MLEVLKILLGAVGGLIVCLLFVAVPLAAFYAFEAGFVYVAARVLQTMGIL